MADRTEQGRELYELGLRLGTLGSVAIGCSGGALAQALSRSLGCGVALAGGNAQFHDGSCDACGVWLAGYYGLPVSVYIRQDGAQVDVSVKDGKGNALCPPGQRVQTPCTGNWDWLAGADGGWAARRALGQVCCSPVAAEGPGALRLLLERMGCDVLSCPRPGMPVLKSDREGYRLTVEWNGITLRPPGEDALDAAARWLDEGRAIPAFRRELI